MDNKTALDNPKRGKKILKLVFSILLWVILGLFLLFTVISIVDRNTGYSVPFFGLRSSVILTGSMSQDISGKNQKYEFKQLQENDLIITYQVDYNDVKIGDIVTYNSKVGLICHRVIEKYSSGEYRYLVTQGDANEIPDSPIEYSLCKGKLIGVIPKVGIVVRFMQSYYFLIAVGFSGFIVFGAIFVYGLTEKKKEPIEPPKE